YRLELAMVGRLFGQDPNLYGDIILASQENIDMIKRFHKRFGEALAILDSKDKAKFVESFEQVSDWFGQYSQQFMNESQNLLKQANDNIHR
ncbi:bifunctional chorismate mutase/prephenate dehydrogenase, partial [Escherichia coli]|nr:bifunctional chorismate mutase/prephenate dehydrogenase [Escherichia coli]